MAVGFDASGDYARITTNLPDVANFTICGFARLKTERNWQAIVSLDDADTKYIQIALDDSTPPRKVAISLSDGGIGSGAFSSRPSNDTWFFWAINNDAGALGRTVGYWTYLDPVSMVVHDPGEPGNQSDFSATGLYLGNDGYDDYGGVWLCHVRVWDAILSQAELEAEAASGTPVKSASLRAYWPLADNTDTGDDSGNGYTLTFGGTLTSETSPTFGGGDETVTCLPGVAWLRGAAATSIASTVGISGAMGKIFGRGLVADATVGGAEPTLTQAHFRWRNDNGDEDGATWYAVEDANASIAVETPIRLRVLVDALNDPDAGQFGLEYRKVGDPDWVVVENA